MKDIVVIYVGVIVYFLYTPVVIQLSILISVVLSGHRLWRLIYDGSSV